MNYRIPTMAKKDIGVAPYFYNALYKLGKHIADELFIKKCKKETSFLRETAFERFRNLLVFFSTMEQDIPQYQIASYLRIKPETLSRLKLLTYINK